MLKLPKIRTYIATYGDATIAIQYEDIIRDVGGVRGNFMKVANDLISKAISKGQQKLADVIESWKYHIYNKANEVPGYTDVMWV